MFGQTGLSKIVTTPCATYPAMFDTRTGCKMDSFKLKDKYGQGLRSPNTHYFNPFSPTDRNNVFANSVDPDETAHNEPSHQDIRCLPFCIGFSTETPIWKNDF